MNLIEDLAGRFALSKDALLARVRKTAFSSAPSATEDDINLFCALAHKYNLNPLSEFYAREDGHGNILPTLKINGWYRVVNDHPEFNGVSFVYSKAKILMTGATDPCNEWLKTVIKRKDRDFPIELREYLCENYKPATVGNTTWQTHTKRRLRHCSYSQCAKMAFGFSGIYTEDEAHAIILATRKSGNAGEEVNQDDPNHDLNFGIDNRRLSSRESKPKDDVFLGSNVFQLKEFSTVGNALQHCSVDESGSNSTQSTLDTETDIDNVPELSSESNEAESSLISKSERETVLQQSVKEFIDKIVIRASKNGTWDVCETLIKERIKGPTHLHAFKYYQEQKMLLNTRKAI